MKKIIILPQAENNLNELLSWYEEKTEGLGQKIIMTVESQIFNTQSNPLLYSKKFKTLGLR